MGSAVCLPLQVLRANQRAGAAVVTLLNPAGALLAGDHVDLALCLGPGAEAELTTVGATRVYRCPPGLLARQRLEARLAPGACLRYLSRGLILHRDAAYEQALALHLARGARAVVGEILGPGRVGERFAYRRLALRAEARVEGALAARDAFDLTGDEVAAALGGFSHVATLLSLGPDVGQATADAVHAAIAASGLFGSASLLPRYGLAARILGSSAQSLYDLMEKLVR